jgi:uncharacterized membrane protein
MTRCKLAVWVLVGAAFLGLIDSAYLGINSLQGFVVPCGVTGGCEEVLNSSYSHLLGLSISWFGFCFYGLVAASALLSVFGFPRSLRVSMAASVLAFIVTLYLLYVQAFVLKAFCQYCLLSALLVTLILGFHLLTEEWKPTAV